MCLCEACENVMGPQGLKGYFIDSPPPFTTEVDGDGGKAQSETESEHTPNKKRTIYKCHDDDNNRPI